MNQSTAKKQKIGFFWPLYLLFLAIFVSLLMWGLSKLEGYLTAFEASQPIYEAEASFEKYFKADSFVPALELAGYKTGEFETLETASDCLKALRGDRDITFYAAVGSQGEICYNVVYVEPQAENTPESGEISVQGIPSLKIGTIYLEKKQTCDEYGFYGYEFSHLEVFLKQDHQVSFTAPSDAKVSLNGKEVSSDYVISTQEHSFNQILPDGVPGIRFCTYEVTGLLRECELSCTDRDGNPMELVKNEQSGAFSAQINYSTALYDQYAQRMLDGMHEYAKYIQRDTTQAKIRQYFDTSSEFYRNIINNYSLFVRPHDGYEFQMDYVGEFYAFDENTFCCHISFRHVLKLSGMADYVDPLDVVVFARRIGNQFYIYDRITQS